MNESAQLAVTARDKLGVELKGIPLMMTSSDPAVASVDSGGTVVALRSGETRIVITADQARAEVPVKVAVFAALKADAPSLDLAVGEAKTPEVQILNEAGAPINGTVRWDSSDDAVASVNTSGYITGVAPGSAKLTGKAGSASISIDVSVRPRGKTP